MSSLSQAQLNDTAVENFREYLRIPSVQPNVNYDECVAFLRRQAESLDLPIAVYEPYPKKPIVIITWTGTDSSAPSIVLNSHMDVVPVFADKWTYPPFSAHMDENGDIYARGSQDMKCVGIQYLEAVRRLKLHGQKLKRTLHIIFVPDEEIGGVLGMREFVHSENFKKLNVGFALDEGLATPADKFSIFNGERSIWQIWIKCGGPPGHGSLLIPNTAGEKLRFIINRFMDLRAESSTKFESGNYQLGDLLSINLTQIEGGVQMNVIPDELKVAFDIRIPPTIDHDEFEKLIRGWCKEAGDDITIEFEQKNQKIEPTKLDESNPFWIAFKDTTDKLGLELEIGIFAGGTDSRYIRSIGLPAIGFSPMNKTKLLLHDHNEFLNKDIFLRGIEIYMSIIPAVANV